MPYVAVESLGQAAAVSIVEARKERPFTSMRDVMERTKINKTLFNRLKVLEPLKVYRMMNTVPCLKTNNYWLIILLKLENDV